MITPENRPCSMGCGQVASHMCFMCGKRLCVQCARSHEGHPVCASCAKVVRPASTFKNGAGVATAGIVLWALLFMLRLFLGLMPHTVPH